MPSYRLERIAEAIREVVASAVLFEVSDPRIQGVTVLSAQVAPDLRSAKVFVSIMGTEAEQKRALRGLQSAAGFLQARVAKRLQTRNTPVLRFELDQSVKTALAVSQLIDQAVADDRQAQQAREGPAPEDDSASDKVPPSNPTD